MAIRDDDILCTMPLEDNLDLTKGIGSATFSRTGPAASYVDTKNNRIAGNNLLWSEEFDNGTWVKVRNSIIANAAIAPDGTLTADASVASTDNNNHRTQQAFTFTAGKPYTGSVYVKAADKTVCYLLLETTDPTNNYAYFDLAAGAVGSVHSNITNASIQDVGDGWFRVSATLKSATGAASKAFHIAWAEADNDPVFVGDDSTVDGYNWGAQLEENSTVGDYVKTTSTAIVGKPNESIRFAGTNLLDYSEQFDEAAWNKTGTVTVSSNVATAPDGLQTADRVNNYGDTTGDRLTQTAISSIDINGKTYTGSLYLKGQGADIGKEVSFRINRDSGGTYTSSPTQTVILTSSWQRVDTGQLTGISGNLGVKFVFTGTGVADPATDFLIWGAQLVEGAKPAEYQSRTQNLLLHSEGFDEGDWIDVIGGTGTASVRSANTSIAPDGTLTADRLQLSRTGDTSSDFSLIQQAVTVPSGANTTKSLWVKSNTGSSQQLLIADSALTSVNSVITVSTEWTRVDINSTVPAATSGLQFGTRGGGSFGGDLSLDVLVWGAQLEESSSASTYQKTTSTLTEDVPRFEKNLVKTIGGNLLSFTEQFDQNVWSTSNTSVTANQAIAPDGTLTADKITNTLAADANIGQTLTGLGSLLNRTFTFSVWLWIPEGETNTDAKLFLFDQPLVDVSSKQLTLTTTPTRYSFTYTFPTTTNTSLVARIDYPDPSASEIGHEVFAWGAQLVENTKPLNYQARTQNLLFASEQFDNSDWGVTRATINTNVAISPDNLQTADKLIPSTDNDSHFVSQSEPVISGRDYTFSCYAKQGEERYLILDVSDSAFGNPARAVFDLQEGTVTDGSNGTDTIEDAGNGWYRCSMSVTATATTTSSFFVSISETPTFDNIFVGNDVDGLFIWGAQLEESSTVSTYQKTTSILTENLSETVEGGVLIEGASTNLVLQSEDFTTTWSSTASVNVTGSTQLRDGLLYHEIEFTTTGGSISQSGVFTAATVNTGSVYAFAGTKTGVAITLGTGGPSDTKSLTGVPQRFSHTGTAATTSLLFENGNSQAGTIWLSAAQGEQLPFATSYIPTVASTVTRDADILSIEPENIPAPTEDYSWGCTVDMLGFESGTFPRIATVVGEGTQRDLRFTGVDGVPFVNHAAFANNTAILAKESHKLFGTKTANDLILYRDAFAGTPVTPGTVTFGPKTAIALGSDGSSENLYGHIKNFRIYNRALTAFEVPNQDKTFIMLGKMMVSDIMNKTLVKSDLTEDLM